MAWADEIILRIGMTMDMNERMMNECIDRGDQGANGPSSRSQQTNSDLAMRIVATANMG